MKRIHFWLKCSRYVSVPQSLMPAVVALLLALGNSAFNLWLGLLACVGAIVAHLGMNLADDYFDYRIDSDIVRNRLVHQGFRARIAKCDYLTSEKATTKQLLAAVIVFLVIAAGLGTIVMLYRGMTILYIALTGLFFGIFYSCPPLKLSSLGLGDVVIGIMFGPLLMAGVYFAACGVLDSRILFISIPTGLLVMNIIFTHSILDRHADRAIGKMTLATLINNKTGLLIASFIFNFISFLIVLAGVCFGILNWNYLFVFLVLPRAIWLFRSMRRFLNDEKSEEKPRKWLGRMENWKRIKDAGIDWFMVRWYASRNLISSFCIIIAVINIIFALCS